MSVWVNVCCFGVLSDGTSLVLESNNQLLEVGTGGSGGYWLENMLLYPVVHCVLLVLPNSSPRLELLGVDDEDCRMICSNKDQYSSL